MSVVPAKPDHLKPSVALLAKLGSIIVHADEMTGPGGHAFDKLALQQLCADPDVIEWLDAMGPLVPKRRT